MTHGTPPGRTPGLSLGTHSLLPAPHGSADQYAFLLPTSWPPTRMPRMRGAISLSMEHPHTWAPGLAQNARAQAEALLAEGGDLPSPEQRGHVRGSQKALWGLLSPKRGTRESPAQCQHSQAVACQPGPLRTTPWLLHVREAGRPCRHCLVLRMALIVSWGPLGTSLTQARRVLRHEAAGPWMLAGRRLGGHSHVTGIPVSPSALQAASGSRGCALVTSKPDSGRGHYLVTARDGGEARLFTITMTASTASEAWFFCIPQLSLLPLRDAMVTSISQMENLRHRTVT